MAEDEDIDERAVGQYGPGHLIMTRDGDNMAVRRR